MEKRTIELYDGKFYDCGVEEFENLKQAVKQGNPKKIAFAAVQVLQSSDDMMNELAKKTSEYIKKLVNDSA